MEVVEAGCSFERAKKPRVLVRRWRGWGSSFDSPAERAQSVCMCRAPWVDCVRMEEPYLHGERRQGGEESLERIKTCVDAKEIFFAGPSLHCERHANSFTRQPLRNAGVGRNPCPSLGYGKWDTASELGPSRPRACARR